MVINHVTSKVVAKAVPDVKEEILAYFLYKEIFINYRVFKELLLDNSINYDGTAHIPMVW
jgi:hypothetical protein